MIRVANAVNFVLLCMAGALVAWAGGTWWQIILAQVICGAASLSGWVHGFEERRP